MVIDFTVRSNSIYFLGIVFDSELEYTLRLRHEVLYDSTWFTSRVGPLVTGELGESISWTAQLHARQGARTAPKYVMHAAGICTTNYQGIYCYTCSFYLSEGFLHLQNAVGLAVIEETIGRTININISVEV